jgi:hypothetical protein
VSPRKRTDQRGEKSTELIYRTKTSFVNRSGQQGCKQVATHYFAFNFWPPFHFSEFSTERLEAILVIWLLAQTGIGSFAGRVGFVLIAGILAAITTNVSYWNWYGFPGVYTASDILIEIVVLFSLELLPVWCCESVIQRCEIHVVLYLISA